MPSQFFSPSRGVREAEARYAVLGISILYWALGWGVAAGLDVKDLYWYVGLATGPMAWVSWMLGWLHSWRSAAWWQTSAMVLAMGLLAWNGKGEQTTLLLNLAVMVVFCGWVLGTRAALVMALAAVALVGTLVLNANMRWTQFLGVAYTIGFFLWVIHVGRRRYERQLHKLQRSL